MTPPTPPQPDDVLGILPPWEPTDEEVRIAELEAEIRGLREERDGLRNAVHQWLGACAAGYFDNLPRPRRDTVREIVKTSESALAGDKQT